jgi:type IV pilus assembly protein PilB
MQRGRNPLINCTASSGIITLHIIANAKSAKKAEKIAQDDETKIQEILGEIVFGKNEETLTEVVGAKLCELGKTLAVAESCTGGALAKSLTDIPGSSQYFTYGWVTYSNESKIRELGIDAHLIEHEGAVSEAVAHAMAAGAKKKSGSAYSIGITGIAGPGGGSVQKPVGLVYICVDGEEDCEIKRFVFPYSRKAMRERTVNTALNILRLKLNIVQKQALLQAIKQSKTSDKRLGQILIETNLIDEETLAKALAKQFGYHFIDIESSEIDPESLKLIPEDLIKKHNILPLGMENGKMKLIISDPLDLEAMDAVRFRLNTELDCYVASYKGIQSFIQNSMQEAKLEQDDRLKHSIDSTTAELADITPDLQAQLLAGGETGSDDGPIVRLVNLIIDNAYFMRASDIHVEPMADRVRIRYRVDGVCLEKDNIPKNMQAPLIARLKILSGMDIAEKRLPQDGRIKREIGGQDIDFRVSSLPAYHGPSVVLRILRPDAVNIGIEALGFEHDDHQRFQQIIKRPNGIFLVTGPTGSGKTTTLYAALQELNRPDKKIITAEDPVEYNFDGMNQCQVKTEINLSFDRILRSMLRQAPNIILVGEIRDGLVADIAIQAALTGHLVFSTLHTNDAPSAITRLIDMGVKPFLVASSIQAIMAQRLVRVICSKCKTVDDNPDPHALHMLNITPEDIKKNAIYKGTGCSQCQQTGYKGRLGIFEMFEMNSELRELAFARAPTTELRKAAQASGMRNLVGDGKIKVFKGITTPQEVARIAQTEGALVE